MSSVIDRPIAPNGAIGSIGNLARALGVSLSKLEELAEDRADRYTRKEKPKKTGGIRVLFDPSDELKAVQRRINARIFRTVIYPRYLYGGIRDEKYRRDYIRCAAVHCSAGVLCQLDVDSFFDSIAYERVFRIFSQFFHYPDAVAELLTKLTTIHESFVPQGAPTSVGISNLVFDGEHQIVRRLAASGVRYTRFIDDIAISHRDMHHPIEVARKSVERMVRDAGFELNAKKASTARATHAEIVFGIRVNGTQPRLTKQHLKELRRELYQLERWASEPNGRKEDDYRRRWHSLSGRITKLKILKNAKYTTYRRRLRVIRPVVHERELSRISAQVRTIERDAASVKNREAFKRRLNRLAHKVSEVAITHENLAQILRDKLHQIRERLSL